MEHFANPRAFYPGSIGPVKFYFPNKGPFESGIAENDKNTGYTQLDSGVVFSLWDSWKTVYDNYNTAKTSYYGLVATYNTAIDNERIRNSDPFKSWFQPEITIPSRPCAPTLPIQVAGSPATHPMPHWALPSLKLD